MAEDPIRPEDEQYHFRDTNSPDVYSGATPPTEDDERLRAVRRTALIALAVIVAVLAFYKLFSMYYAKPSSPTPVTVSQPAVTPMQTVPVTVAPPDAAPRLTQLEQNQSAIQESVQSLTTQINDLKSTISEQQGQMTSLRESVESLSKTVQTETALLQQLTTPKAKPAHPPALITYYLQALVPGRAWLRGPNQEMITVSTGDTLRTYGTITQILVDKGEVVTSSGRLILYKASDR
jgi:intracellular multiplication protein IcmG